METESTSAEQVAAEQSNWILDFVGSIPIELWVVVASVVASAIVGIIGWFGRTAFDTCNKKRLPFKQDRERFEAVIASIDPLHFHYLKQTPMDSIGSRALDGIDDAGEKLSQLAASRAAYLDRKLSVKEDQLRECICELANFLPLQLYPHRVAPNVFTMFWDNFDEWNDEQQQMAAQKKREIMSKVDAAISAFEAYRDFGNKLFADRLVKEKSVG